MLWIPSQKPQSCTAYPTYSGKLKEYDHQKAYIFYGEKGFNVTLADRTQKEGSCMPCAELRVRLDFKGHKECGVSERRCEKEG